MRVTRAHTRDTNAEKTCSDSDCVLLYVSRTAWCNGDPTSDCTVVSSIPRGGRQSSVMAGYRPRTHHPVAMPCKVRIRYMAMSKRPALPTLS